LRVRRNRDAIARGLARNPQVAKPEAVDLNAAIDKLIRSGLDVSAGFIMGFDADDAEALASAARLGPALAHPAGHDRHPDGAPRNAARTPIEREGRLIDRASGETFGRPNFRTRVTESVLLEIYGKSLARIYEPKEYFKRCLRALRLRPSENARLSLPLRYALACLFRSIWRQGLTGGYRKAYWRFLAQVLAPYAEAHRPRGGPGRAREST
jgi:hypothetical protein